MKSRLEIDALCWSPSSRRVLDGVNLSLQAGELVGLVGPNGSGKSSLLRCVAGLLKPDSGAVRIAGIDIAVDPRAARRALGYAVELDRLPPRLNGRQCLQLVADLRDIAPALPGAFELSAALGLSDWLDAVVETYSFGTRQKLSIVLAMLGDPPLVVLDEVLNGLDPLAAYALKQALRERADRGATVLLATHGLEVAERFLDRAVLLLDGCIAADWDATALAAFRADPQGGLEHAVVERLRAARGLAPVALG